MRRLTCLLALLVAAPSTAGAQLRIVHDTLGAEMPTAITCGFCAGERFGVVFRELPGARRGLEPTDFPLLIDAIDVGMGAANVESMSCVPQRSGGTIEVILEVYAGDTPPTGDIRALPADAAWPGERLVWASDAVPLTLSVEDDTGQYQLRFNRLEIRDEDSMPVEVDTGAYLRVVITLPEGAAGTSDICGAPLVPPGGFPVRDDDGRIAPERNFIYAGGAGWFWSESVPGGAINGDWGMRLSVFPSGEIPDGGVPTTDGGLLPSTDGGAATDAGAGGADAGATGMDGGGGGADAGPTVEPTDDGCSCRAAQRGRPAPVAFVLVLALTALWRRRR